MPKLSFSDFSIEIPDNWKDQGMMTLTMPSTDPKVRPNIIVTKERLNQPVTLDEYFERIKKSVQSRGIESFKIVAENDVMLSSQPGKMLICAWDLSAMKEMMGAMGQNLDHVKPGQTVKQIQVTCVRNDVAINITASFPEEQFEVYARPFQQFIKNFQFLS
jgi:hypothetical protein